MASVSVSSLIAASRRAVAAARARVSPALLAASARSAAGLTALRRFDLPGRIVTGLDRIERIVASVTRVVRAIARSGFARLGAGLVWRGAAAAAGIAAATALVSGLSSDQGQADAKNATEEVAETASPAVRNVRRQPWLPAGTDGWIVVNRPLPMFALAAPDLESTGYEVRRNADGTRREDLLSFGRMENDRQHLRLRLSVGAVPAAPEPLLVTLAREAANNGLSVHRSSLPVSLDTRFGGIETTDIRIEDGSVTRACVAFRHQAGEEGFGFVGWWCGSADRPADRRQLACLIDRIDLASAGSEPGLRAIFVRSELSRPAHCTRPYLATTGRKASWLDAEAKAPPLRGTPPSRPERQRGKQKL